MSVAVYVVVIRVKEERKLRRATWNFSGLCSECKQKK